MVKRLRYGVSHGEVEGFVAENRCVREFLGRYSESSHWLYACDLCRFFKWLRLVKRLELGPEELLNEHLRLRSSVKIRDRRWALKLVLEWSRDNPDNINVGYSRRKFMFTAVQQFFNYHEAPLTMTRGVFGKRMRRRKYKPKQMSVGGAKRVLAAMSQRERTVLICMLQSGMSLGDVLRKFNFMLDDVVGCLKSGAGRFRIDMAERKGNGFNYFTFISADALHEIRKWLALRSKLPGSSVNSDAIFITKTGKPFTVLSFEVLYDYHLRRAKLKDGRYSFNTHMFRKLFKTEASPPERGIDRDCVEFMMGHLSGIQSVGGVYDRTPELYAGVIEREYAKLEPYINIYSSKTTETEGLDITKEDAETLKQLLKMFKQGKIKVSL